MESTSVLKCTPIAEISQIVCDARSAFDSGKTRPVEFRRQQLNNLYRLFTENNSRLQEALHRDLHKPPQEASLMELQFVVNDIVECLDNLEEWTRPRKVEVDLLNKLNGCQIRPEPLGLVLVIGAWNYPIQLTLGPLAGIIAAGNCAVIKPSEVSPHTAQLVAELLPRYLDNQCFKVINGGVSETTALLDQRFDKILYTGNGSVAKIIMTAAAKYLTPVILELGGKSPAIVDAKANVQVAGRRIAWGRFINCGQTCIAPDYVMCERSVQPALVEALRNSLLEFFGEDPQQSPNYARIVNKRHFQRLSRLLGSGTRAIGGTTDEKDLYIAPTVLTDVTLDAPVMQDEIFGPILPIVTVDNVDHAIRIVNNGDKPLALYVFSEDRSVCEKVLQNTSSGGAVANDCLMHAGVPALPFGGVGASGTGAYHGKFTFDQFSHMKSVMVMSTGLEALNTLRYPPYTDAKLNWLGKLMFRQPSTRPRWLGKLYLLALVGLLAAFFFKLQGGHFD